MLTRSFLSPSSSKKFLAYSPMLHARLFIEDPKYRASHFEPIRAPLPYPPDPVHQSLLQKSDLHLDGHPEKDRPLFVQFCANSPDDLFNAAQLVQPYCDAVDLNLGCPQAIAKRGYYGSYLQEDWDLIYRLINKLHKGLDIPVTAKIRILETREKTLDYARMVLSAGASILTVHGRQRHQKGHNSGLADWTVIRYLRDNLPRETVIFANGNILRREDMADCMSTTGADAVMSAEGNLADPSIFAEFPDVADGREVWKGRDGKCGYRLDFVFRKYMDIIYRDVLGVPAPVRTQLYLPGDVTPQDQAPPDSQNNPSASQAPKRDRRGRIMSPNLVSMQGHLFSLLRPLLTKHTHIRDLLAKSRVGDLLAYESLLRMVEEAVKEGLIGYENSTAEGQSDNLERNTGATTSGPNEKDNTQRTAAEICKMPWWICQAYIRPLPQEALEKGSLTLGKKHKNKLLESKPEETVVILQPGNSPQCHEPMDHEAEDVRINKEGLVCG